MTKKKATNLSTASRVMKPVVWVPISLVEAQAIAAQSPVTMTRALEKLVNVRFGMALSSNDCHTYSVKDIKVRAIRAGNGSNNTRLIFTEKDNKKIYVMAVLHKQNNSVGKLIKGIIASRWSIVEAMP